MPSVAASDLPVRDRAGSGVRRKRISKAPIVDRTGSFEIALVIAAVVAVVGALSYLLGVRSTIELDTLLDEPMTAPVV